MSPCQGNPKEDSMLNENETPEMSETPQEETVNEENPTPTPEDSTPEITEDKQQAEVEDTSAPETVVPAEETIAEESEEKKTETEPVAVIEEKKQEEAEQTEVSEQEASTEANESPVEEVQSAEPTPEAEKESTPVEVPKEESPSQEETPAAKEEKTQSESPSSDPPQKTSQGVADLPPLNEALNAKIEEVLKSTTGGYQILAGATLTDLIHLITQFSQQDNVLPFSARVGLVKRTFDTLKYQPEFDKGLGDRFLQGLAEFNRKRLGQRKVAESQREENSRHKKDLIEKLKLIVDAEDPTKIQEVRAVQDEWKTIGHVLKADIEPLYREYRFLLDKFYRLREMHFELLDYDRKINLQEKERLIKEAEKLIPPEEDREDGEVWRERMDLLAEIQQQWKAAGHVPREEMDRINSEFRAVVDNFFEVRQGFMEVQDQLRTENGTKKQAILEKMAPFAAFTAERPRAWNDATRELRALQEEWKSIGQAPYKINSELWSKYREHCNAFFSNKSAFFKKFDEFRAENLEKKRALVDRVEELVRQGEWEKTAKELKEIQRNWKEIGPVPERHSNKLWNRFRTACDTFFENRRTHYRGLHKGEHANLEAKKALIEEVKKLDVVKLGGIDGAIKKIKEIQAKWKEIGKVPYKEKDTIWEKFRAAIDQFFDGLSGKREELRELRLKSSIESLEDSSERGGIIRSKITRLRRKIGQAQEKVDQYSNNILFIAKGKKGDSLRNQIQKEIDKEKRIIQEWKKEIRALNEALKNPPKPKPKEEPKPKAEEKAEAPAETPAATEETSKEEAATPAVEEPKVEEKVEAPAETPAATEETPKEEVAPAVEEPKAEEKAEAPAETPVATEETPKEAAAPAAEEPKAEEKVEASAEETPKEEAAPAAEETKQEGPAKEEASEETPKEE